MRTKICTKCHKRKLLNKFYKASNQKTGIRPDCKDCSNEYYKEYYKKNYLQINKYWRNYYRTNRNELLNYRKNNLHIYNKQRKIRRFNDISYKIKENLRNRLRQALKGQNKALSTMFLIGCEIDYLMYHIQKQFKYGMTWDNHGEWHIDHKLPCASFDLSKPKEQRKCFNFKNLQPLWAIDNIRKGNKI